MLITTTTPTTTTSISRTRVFLAVAVLLFCVQTLTTPVMAERFPPHWKDKPLRQTRDLVKLPGGFGEGSSTLRAWILKNMENDKGKYDKTVNDEVVTDKTDWPELVGMDAAEAKKIIETEGAGRLNTIQIIPDGHMMTMDFREDRVRIIADADQKVVKARVG